MSPTLFLIWRDVAVDAAALRTLARGLDGLASALAHTPAPADAAPPFAKDGAGPALTLELWFSSKTAFAAGVTTLSEKAPGGFAAQAMRGRTFATPDPAFRLGPGARPCTLLVEYLGQCDNLAGWLDHYDAHHPVIMARFPAVREVATYRAAPDLPLPRSWPRADAMQRNKVAFDSPAALATALGSPVMREMRADFQAFPPYAGGPRHYPNATLDLLPPA